jgi:ethanolamine transporter EutH
MIWFKSFGVGLLAVLVTIPVGFLLLGLILKAKSGHPTISIDIVSVSRIFVVRLVLVLVFALGFLWEYRRLTRH